MPKSKDKSVKELRSLLTSIGLETTGTRETLMDRIYSAVQNMGIIPTTQNSANANPDTRPKSPETPFHDARRRISLDSHASDHHETPQANDRPTQPSTQVENGDASQESSSSSLSSSPTIQQTKKRISRKTKMAAKETAAVALTVATTIDAELRRHRDRMVADQKRFDADMERERSKWRRECELRELKQQHQWQQRMADLQKQFEGHHAQPERHAQCDLHTKSGAQQKEQTFVHEYHDHHPSSEHETQRQLQHEIAELHGGENETDEFHHERELRHNADRLPESQAQPPQPASPRPNVNAMQQERGTQRQRQDEEQIEMQHRNENETGMLQHEREWRRNADFELPAHHQRSSQRHNIDVSQRERETHQFHHEVESRRNPERHFQQQHIEAQQQQNRYNQQQRISQISLNAMPASAINTWQPRLTSSQVAEQLPIFDPDDTIRGSSNAFIDRIQVLANYHGWDDRLVVIAAQTKLRGAAEIWNESSSPHYASFVEFANQLRATFPDLQTEADVHEELVRATREPNENLQSFCHRMVAIARKGHIPEQTVVHHILKRVNHRDFSISVINTPINTLSQLYGSIARFRQAFPDDTASNPVANTARATSVSKTSSVDPSKPAEETNSSRGRSERASRPYCANCKTKGHLPNDCPHPRIECTNCKKLGHLSDVCRSTTVMAVDNHNSHELIKDVLVNNVRMQVFIDGGSKQSFIRRTAAQQIEREEDCEPIQVSGFGSSSKSVLCTTKITPTLKLDDTIYRATLYVVNDADLPKALPSILLGKDLLCRNGNRLVITEGTCFIEQAENAKSTCPAAVNDLIKRFQKSFANSLTELGTCNTTSMTIELTQDAPIICRRAYRIPLVKRKIIDDMVNDLLTNNIIRPSTSAYASPVVLLKKANGEDRMCIDFRELNAVTVKETFPMPVIEEMLEYTANMKFFSVLDLKSGFYQIPVSEASTKYTAFVTHCGHYEFLRMPFGLVNAPSVFQRAMNELQKLLQPGDCQSYLDDTIIASRTIDEGLEKLERFLIALQKTGLTLRLDKCVFLAESITFLGHEISANGIEPGDRKTKTISEYPVPKNSSDVRRFLGLTGFFRKFVNGYATLVKPLTMLTKTKDAPQFEWTDPAQQSFDELKIRLTTKPILCTFDPDKPHEVHTDASKIGLAAVLFQREENGLRPVFYYSRHCSKAEQNYAAYELEVLAIVTACERFRVYLIGRHFKIVTDCAAVTTMRRSTPVPAKIERWWSKLLVFDYELIHRPGEQLAYVDAMSRAPTEQAPETCVMRIDINHKDWLATMQYQDNKIKSIVNALNGSGSSTTDDVRQLKTDYELDGGRLFRKTKDGPKWYVPAGVRWRMLKAAHDDRGHYGLEKTLQQLKQGLWFPRMRNYTKSYLTSCVECCYNKRPGGTSEGQLHISETVPIPFHTIHLDHVGPFTKSSRGNTHVLGIADAFSKHVQLKAVKSTKTAPVLNMLREMANTFGFAHRIVTDRGTAFTSKAFKDFCEENSIQHIQNAVRTPRANGQIERINQNINTYLRTTTVEAKKWDATLHKLQWAINTQLNNTTGCCPNDVIFRFKAKDVLQNKVMAVLSDAETTEPIVPSPNEIAAKIFEAKSAWKRRYDDQHRAPKHYSVGDIVLVEHIPAATGDSRKLEPRYRGPYVVDRVLNNDRYLICDIDKMQRNQRRFESVFSSEKMKMWCSMGPPDEAADDSDSESNEEDDINTTESANEADASDAE